MNRRRLAAVLLIGTIACGGASLASPPPARAFDPLQSLCSVAGMVNGLAQKACSLVGGGGSGLASTATTALTLAAVVAWVVGGASYMLHATSHVLGATTSPQLASTWFSATYWRVAEIAAVLTLPFLFAAALQALARADLPLLIRAVAGYLPLAFLSVAIAAPMTMLLLSATDELSAAVGSAAGHESTHFLGHATVLLGLLAARVSSPFVVFLVALFTVVGALVLWMELLVRAAAVYVIVLMLPLAFAAFVWPARRIWAIRSIELLAALILSKFAIVAVLSLGGAALDRSANGSVTGLLAGAVLLALAAFAPWAMLRLIPLAEVASAAAGSLSAGSNAMHRLRQSDAWAAEGADWAAKTAQMRDFAGEPETADGARAAKEDADANAPRATGAPAVPAGPSNGESARPDDVAVEGDGAGAPPAPDRAVEEPEAAGTGVDAGADSRDEERSVIDIEAQPAPDLGRIGQHIHDVDLADATREPHPSEELE